MDIDVLQDQFPQGRISLNPQKGKNEYLLPLKDGRYYRLDGADLTPAERTLLAYFSDFLSGQEEAEEPWLAYFNQRRPSPPENLGRLQMIHLAITWLDGRLGRIADLELTLGQMFNNLVTSFVRGEGAVTLVLQQETFQSPLVLIQDVLPLLEDDFNCQITVMLGQVWSSQVQEEWPKLYQREVAAFDLYLARSARSSILTFLDLLYWLSIHSETDFQYFVSVFYQFIHYFEMEDVIRALWKERGVQTKAAQRLFLHRNTLQHKLDRFLDRSGLDLKNLDDLALCYLSIQSHIYN